METSQKIIIMVAGLVLACLFVSFGFYVYNNARETGNGAVAQVNELNSTLTESEFTQYEGTEVTGSEVLNAVKRFQNVQLCVTVNGVNYGYTDDSLTTKQTSSAFGTAIANAKDKSNANYINPNAKYIGSLTRDEDRDNAIVALVFTKK